MSLVVFLLFVAVLSWTVQFSKQMSVNDNTIINQCLFVVYFRHIIHGAMFLPLAYALTVRQSPWIVLKGAAPALWTALVTASR